MKLPTKLKSIMGPLSLLSVVVLLFLKNYSPGSWFSGWDNLHTEFSVLLNLKRAIFAVWQEYQGLGLLGGNAHAADLIRQMLTLPFLMVLPASLFRYFFFFSMLCLGGLGAYWFIKSLYHKSNIISLLAGLFYILNLATLQTFYIPLEAFAIHFAALPWLLGYSLRYLESGKKRDFMICLFINVLAISQSFIPTIFVVYMIFLLVIIISTFLQNKKRESIKRSFILISTILLINAFWLLPFIYFFNTNVQVIVNAKINQYGTEKVISQNLKYGTLKDVVMLKGFALDNLSLSIEKNFEYIMPSWRQHTQLPIDFAVSIIMFFIILVGLFTAFKKKNPYNLPLLLLFALTFTILVNNTPPFSFFTILLQNTIPLFKQVFRASFTKFSLGLGLYYSIFFALGADYIYNLIQKIIKNNLRLVFPAFLFVLLFIVSYPSFRGNFIYPEVRLKIPQEYFDLFQYFKTQPLGRIANLPQPWFWGWSDYGWGYDGSGFLWYGIEQPIMDRAFDVWSKEDENYYWELSYALYSGNVSLLEKVINKYQVRYILMDKSIRSYSNYRALFIEHIDSMLQRSNILKLEKTFGKDLEVYSIQNNYVNNFIYLIKNPISISPVYRWNDYDKAFVDYSTYISKIGRQNSFIYPFRSLFSGRNQDELETKIQDFESSITLSNQFNSNNNDLLNLPPISTEESQMITSNLQEQTTKPAVFLDNYTVPYKINGIEIPLTNSSHTLDVQIYKQTGYYSYNSSKDNNFYNQPLKRCDTFSSGPVQKQIVSGDSGNAVRFTSQNSSNCMSIELPNLTQKTGYIVIAKTKHIAGDSMLFYIVNKQAKQTYLETHLPNPLNISYTSYFIIPPMEKYGLGYSIHFDNMSTSKQLTINELENVEIYPIPYDFLKSIHTTNSNYIYSSEINYVPLVSHQTPYLYQINSPLEQGVLALSQSYSKGWKAYYINDSGFINTNFPFFFGTEIKDHVLVNNWANGWKIPVGKLKGGNVEKSTIVIIFWPQYLEFVGFGFIIIGILFILFYRSETEVDGKVN